jgi:hypothetical protein
MVSSALADRPRFGELSILPLAIDVGRGAATPTRTESINDVEH